MTTHRTGRRVGATAAGIPTLSGANVIDNPQTPDPTPESARALLYRYGLPEDVIDGALCLHAQELAGVQRTHADQVARHSGDDQFSASAVTGMRAVAAFIDPTHPEEPAGPRCGYCGADCSSGRSYDGGGLYACGRYSEARTKRDPAVLPAVPVSPTTHATDEERRDRIAAAMREHYLCTDRGEADADGNSPCRCGDWRESGPMGSEEEDWDSHMADVALAELHRMADEAQQQKPTTADKAAALGMTDTEYRARSHEAAVAAVRAAIPGMYAAVGFRLEDVLNEAAGAHPPGHRWYVETLDELAEEWAPGMRFTDRAEALARFETVSRNHPTWKDGAPVRRRFVRETTSYTVEQPASGPGRVADEEPAETPCRCVHNDIVYGRCVMPALHDGECFHERQSIRIDEETDDGSLCSAEYPGDDNFVGQLCGLPARHYGDHRCDVAIGDGVHTVLLRWRSEAPQ